MEDSRPKPLENIKPIVEKEEGAAIPSITTEPQQPIEDPKQTEEAKAVREQARLDRIEELRQKLDAPGAGEQVTIAQPEKPEVVEDKTAEKIKTEFDKELSKSMIRLSAEVQKLEDSLRLDKFSPISFNPESFKFSMTDGPIDFQKAIIAVEDLQVNLKKSFAFKNEGGTISTDPHRFNRVIDSLNSLNGLLIGLRRQVEKRPEIENRQLSESLTKAINATRKRKEDMEESQALLQRYARR